MRWNQHILAFLFLFLASIQGYEIPEKFLGEWELKRTENMDAYMIARGTFLIRIFLWD